MARDGILRKIRHQIKSSGNAIIEGRDYDGDIQRLYADMNAAKIAAMKKAEEPFLEKIREIEEEYGIFLLMKAKK